MDELSLLPIAVHAEDLDHLQCQKFNLVEEVPLTGDVNGPCLKKYVSDKHGLNAVFQKTQSKVVEVRVLANTYAENDNGAPHALEHILLRSRLTERLMHKNLGSLQNAYTAMDHTAFMLEAATDKNLVAFLPRIMKDLKRPGDSINPVSVGSEVHHINDKGERRGTVFSEMVMRENMKECLGDADIRKAYAPGTPYEHVAGGSVKAVPTLTADDLLQFHKLHYRWSNMTVVVRGDIDEELILQCLEKIEDDLGADEELSQEEIQKLEHMHSAKPKPLLETLNLTTPYGGQEGAPGEIWIALPVEEEGDGTMMPVAREALSKVVFHGAGSLVGGSLIKKGAVSTSNDYWDYWGKRMNQIILEGVSEYDDVVKGVFDGLVDASDRLSIDMVRDVLKKMRKTRELKIEYPPNEMEWPLVDVIARKGDLSELSLDAIDKCLAQDIGFWKGLMDSLYLKNNAIVNRLIPGDHGTLREAPPVNMTDEEAKEMAHIAAKVAEESTQKPSKEDVDALPSSDADVQLPALVTLKNYDAPDVNGRTPTYYAEPQTPGQIRTQSELEQFGIPVAMHDVKGSCVSVNLISRLPREGDKEVEDMTEDEVELMQLSQVLLSKLGDHCGREYRGQSMAPDEFLRAINGDIIEHYMYAMLGLTRNPTLSDVTIKTHIDDLYAACQILESAKTINLTNENVKKLTDAWIAEYTTKCASTQIDDDVRRIWSSDPKFTRARALSLLEKHQDNIDGIREALQKTLGQLFDPKRATLIITGDTEKLDTHAFERMRKIGDFSKKGNMKPSLLDTMRPGPAEPEPLPDMRVNLTSLTPSNPTIMAATRIPDARDNLGHVHTLNKEFDSLGERFAVPRNAGDCYCITPYHFRNTLHMCASASSNPAGVSTKAAAALEQFMESTPDVEFSKKVAKLGTVVTARDAPTMADLATSEIVAQEYDTLEPVLVLDQLEKVTPESVVEYSKRILPSMASAFRGDGGCLVSISKDNDSMNRSLEEHGIPIATHLDKTETAEFLQGKTPASLQKTI